MNAVETEAGTRSVRLQSLSRGLFAPVDIASLVYFRVAFGLIMMWEVWRYFDNGWIKTAYMGHTLHFTYYGFGWVHPWPGEGMYWHFLALGLVALCVVLGFCYRIAATLCFLAFTYIFLLEQARYLNHFYLVSLISFLMICVPAHRARSLDAWFRPRLRSETAPAWALWILRVQIGLAYFYGGVAKLNLDWFRGEPVRMWLARRSDYALIGPLLEQEWVVWTITWGGLLYDLLVFPLLLWRRTRVVAYGFTIGFHLTNAILFDIGIFPWFMLAATLLFFEPDWPRRAVLLVPPRADPEPPPAAPASLTAGQWVTLVLVGIFVALQVLVPLRHFLYPGVVHWTEEGHRFAWHMKLRDKKGRARFRVTSPATGETWTVKPSKYLDRRQVRKMTTRPDMALQFAHFLAEEYRKKGHARVEVRADIKASLNGRERQVLIDPEVDLAAEPRTLGHATWILPLEEPLRREAEDQTRGE